MLLLTKTLSLVKTEKVSAPANFAHFRYYTNIQCKSIFYICFGDFAGISLAKTTIRTIGALSILGKISGWKFQKHYSVSNLLLALFAGHHHILGDCVELAFFFG